MKMFQILNFQLILKQMKGGGIMKLKNLIKFRIDNNLSSRGMAKKLDLSPTAYSNLENGKKKPTIAIAFKIQEVFEVDDVLELFAE